MAINFRVIGGRMFYDGDYPSLTKIEDGHVTAELAFPETNVSDLSGGGFGPVAISTLTEAGGAIGGTNDGDLPDLDATAATLAGTLTGTTDGTLADVAAINIAAGDPANPTEAEIEAAVNGMGVDITLQIKELQTTLNAVIADNVALRAGIRECASAIVEIFDGLDGVNTDLEAIETLVNSHNAILVAIRLAS